ncbi:MAG: hypothetical protein GTN76_08650, partial [Candidatus Aenigmarchaeota archaeon]|nr:hypothetical protein [Candidatus Aenigmarchaeota archaeon]
LQKLHPEHFLSEEAGHIFSAIEKVANNDTFDAALVAKDLERKGYDGVSQINNIINSGYS